MRASGRIVNGYQITSRLGGRDVRLRAGPVRQVLGGECVAAPEYYVEGHRPRFEPGREPCRLPPPVHPDPHGVRHAGNAILPGEVSHRG